MEIGGSESTMETQEIRDHLARVFRDVFDDESIYITDDMTAKDVEEWDSLNHINLIVAVERDFRIHFTTREVSEVANVGEFIALISSKLS